MSLRRAEVAVVGGGPAGAVAALVLARRGLEVVLVEADDYCGPRIGESFPPAVGGLVARLGLVGLPQAVRMDGYGLRSAWGGPEPEVRSHVCQPGAVGWHVDRARFDAALAFEAQAAGARRLHARLTGARRLVDGWRLQLSRGGEVEARLVLDASGRRAAFARFAGARRTRTDALTALAFEGLPAPIDRYGAYALVEAAPDGWWYSAPIPGGRAVAVRFSHPAGLRTAPAPPPLTARRHAGLELGPGRRHPAGASLLEPVCGEGWLAIGDAAMTFDPMSGDGVCRALASGMAAAEAVLTGGADALRAEAEETAARFAAYARARADFYAAERRWPDAPFWTWTRSLRPPPSAAAGAVAPAA